MDSNGWANTDELLKKLPFDIDFEMLLHVVETNEKKRFVLSEDGNRIRANQGHSIDIDLGLSAKEPPATLYHGTATRFLDAIMKDGLKPMSRQHVHLSMTIETAMQVGQRHGKATVLEVPAKQLAAAGQDFYQSENGVWLTGPISPDWIKETP